MFETDFPYSTSLSPEPASCARNQRETISDALAGVDEIVVRKISTKAQLGCVASPSWRCLPSDRANR